MNINNNKCQICNSEIPLERIEVLKKLEILSNNFLCISCASNTYKPYRALYDNKGANIILVSGLGGYGIDKLEEKEESEENMEEFN
jgi:hypothetical protein